MLLQKIGDHCNLTLKQEQHLSSTLGFSKKARLGGHFPTNGNFVHPGLAFPGPCVRVIVPIHECQYFLRVMLRFPKFPKCNPKIQRPDRNVDEIFVQND
jgi:hypothetical protein